MTMFLLDDDHDGRDNYAVIFSDTPYEVLNGAKFDVGNFEINNLTGLCRMSSCISFSIIQGLSNEVCKAFSKWSDHIFSHTNDLHNEYEATATLLRYDKDCRLLCKYALYRVFPTYVSFGHSMRGKSLAEIIITSYFNRIIDDNEMSNAENKADQELKKEEQNKEMQEKKEEKSTIVLDEVKPLVQMMNKLDELRDTIDDDSHLYSCEFAEAISEYNELLGCRCLEIVRDACKDK